MSNARTPPLARAARNGQSGGIWPAVPRHSNLELCAIPSVLAQGPGLSPGVSSLLTGRGFAPRSFSRG